MNEQKENKLETEKCIKKCKKISVVSLCFTFILMLLILLTLVAVP